MPGIVRRCDERPSNATGGSVETAALTRRSFRTRTHAIVGRLLGWLTVAGLFVLPVVWVTAKHVSLLLPEYEFVGYRFFTSLAILAGQPQGVIAIQGFPMGILQHAIVWVLTVLFGRSPVDIATLETFAVVNLVLAYGLGALALAWVWGAGGLVWSDRLLLSSAMLVPLF